MKKDIENNHKPTVIVTVRVIQLFKAGANWSSACISKKCLLHSSQIYPELD